MKRLAIAVALAALVGCSGGDPVPSTPATYETAAQLKDAAVGAGYDCPQWSDADPDVGSPLGFDAGKCLDGPRDQMRVYRDTAAREADMTSASHGCYLLDHAGSVDLVILTANNWLVCGPKASVTTLKDKLGGELVEPKAP